MAKLPGVEDIGVDRAASARPVASYDVAPIARGAQELAAGAQKLGAGVQQAGAGAAELADDESRWQFTKAHADFISRKVDLDAAVSKDQNYAPDASGKDLPTRYSEQLNGIRAQSSNLIQSPAMRELFMTHTESTVEQGKVSAQAHAKALSNDANLAYVDQMSVKTMNQAVAAPDDASRGQLIDSHNQLIDGLAAQGVISRDRAVSMKQEWAHQYASADVLARSDRDPQGVINELRAAPGSDEDIDNRILGNEGRAKNDKSSATGTGQFIDGTWLDVVKRNRPDLAQGRSDQQILSLRADDNLGREMTTAYRKENSAALQKQGLQATPGNLYLAHFLGAGGAAAVLKADPNMPVEDALTQAVGPDQATKMVNANPEVLRGKLAGSVTEWSNGKMGGSQRLVDMIRPDVREQLLSHAMQVQQKQNVNDLAGFKQQIEDTQAEAMRTGAVEKPLQLSDFVGKLGAEQGPKSYASYQSNVQLGQDIKSVSTLPPDKQAELLQSYQPKPGPGFSDAADRQDALRKAIAQTQKARTNDPDFKARIESTIEEAGRTGKVEKPVTEDEFKYAMGGDAGGKAYAQYSASVRAGHDVQTAAEMSPAEQGALLHGYEPQPGPDYADQAARRDVVAKAIAQVNKERANDPAGFAASRLPATMDAYKSYATVMGDPTASPAQRQVAARSFAVTSLMEQQNAGIPTADRQILPQTEVDRFTNAVQQAANSDDPKARTGLVAYIKSQREMWGDEYWPKIAQQLGPKQAPVVNAITAGADESAMVRLLGLGKDDNPAKILKEQSDVKFSDLSKEINTTMAPFMSSLVGRQRDRDFPGMYGLVEKLAATYVRDDGKSASDAAGQAYKDVIGGLFDFRDTFRVPKDKNASWDPDRVQAGAIAARRQLEELGGVAARDDIGGLTDSKAESLRNWRDTGTWVTSQDNSGLNMVYGSPSGAKFMRTKTGEPLLVPWAKLDQIGGAQPAFTSGPPAP